MTYSTNLQSWGSTGAAPPSNYGYVEGEQPVDDWDNWFNYNVINELTDVIDLINDIDSNTDGVVDEAETSNAFKDNDIDTDGDGVVNEADSGQNVTGTYKGNDIDTDGDGVVNDSQRYDGLLPSDGTSDQVLQTDGVSAQWADLSSLWTGDGTLLSPSGSEIGINVDKIQNDDYKEAQVTGTASSTYDIDLSSSNVHKVTLTGDASFSFSSVSTSMVNQATVYVIQDGTGGRAPSFSNVRWPNGQSPTWSTSANAIDIVTFLYDPDDNVWDGFIGGTSFS